jgi:hypothetical protein
MSPAEPECGDDRAEKNSSPYAISGMSMFHRGIVSGAAADYDRRPVQLMNCTSDSLMEYDLRRWKSGLEMRNEIDGSQCSHRGGHTFGIELLRDG